MILHSRASIYMGESVVVQPVSLASRWGTSILGGGPQVVCGGFLDLLVVSGWSWSLWSSLWFITFACRSTLSYWGERANEGGREGETKRQGDRI